MYREEAWKYFQCKRCGKCCEEVGLPRIITFEEFENLCYFLRTYNPDEIITQYLGRVVEKDGNEFIIYDDKKRRPCPFLKKDKDYAICSIYPVRPDGCKCYPTEVYWDFNVCPEYKKSVSDWIYRKDVENKNKYRR